jgi:hypothetical protein
MRSLTEHLIIKLKSLIYEVLTFPNSGTSRENDAQKVSIQKNIKTKNEQNAALHNNNHQHYFNSSNTQVVFSF